MDAYYVDIYVLGADTTGAYAARRHGKGRRSGRGGRLDAVRGAVDDLVLVGPSGPSGEVVENLARGVAAPHLSPGLGVGLHAQAAVDHLSVAVDVIPDIRLRRYGGLPPTELYVSAELRRDGQIEHRRMRGRIGRSRPAGGAQRNRRQQQTYSIHIINPFSFEDVPVIRADGPGASSAHSAPLWPTAGIFPPPQ